MLRLFGGVGFAGDVPYQREECDESVERQRNDGEIHNRRKRVVLAVHHQFGLRFTDRERHQVGVR